MKLTRRELLLAIPFSGAALWFGWPFVQFAKAGTAPERSIRDELLVAASTVNVSTLGLTAL